MGADFEGRWVASWMCVCVCVCRGGGASGLSGVGGLRGLGLRWIAGGEKPRP